MFQLIVVVSKRGETGITFRHGFLTVHQVWLFIIYLLKTQWMQSCVRSFDDLEQKRSLPELLPPESDVSSDRPAARASAPFDSFISFQIDMLVTISGISLSVHACISHPFVVGSGNRISRTYYDNTCKAQNIWHRNQQNGYDHDQRLLQSARLPPFQLLL